MSAERDPSRAAAAVLPVQYEWINSACVAAFLAAHPSLVPALEDLHDYLARTFIRARFVLRHLTSPHVPSPEGDGHLLVVVSGDLKNDAAGRLSAVLRHWASQHDAARAFILVALASDAIDPYAGEADALALYVRLRSDGYKRYLDAARRFLSAEPDSEEQVLAGAELSIPSVPEAGQRIAERGGDPREVLARLRKRETPTDLG